MKIRVRLIDFMGVCNGQLAGKVYWNLSSEAKEEDFTEKYGIEKETLEKMKEASKKGNFRILQGIELKYCMFCGSPLDNRTCRNCGASFEAKLSEEGAAKVRIIGKRRQPLHSLRRFSSKAAVYSPN